VFINPIVKWISEVGSYGLEYAARRYYGLYGANVESNVDYRQQGRVSARIGVLGIGTSAADGIFTPEIHSEMLSPITPYAGRDHGIYFPPEDGDVIYVSFDYGDPDCPRYVGSSWPNPSASKTAAGSFLPSEFKSTGIPTKRGIKTKYGHGLIFSDTDDDPFVTLWSGTQQGTGVDALKQQQISLVNDGGYKDPGIYSDTFYGHRLHLNDRKRSITLAGKSADPEALLSNLVKIEDAKDKVLIKTVGAQSAAHHIELDDKLKTITIKSKDQQSVVIDDNLQTITIKTKAQQSIILDDKSGVLSVTGISIVNVDAGTECNVSAGGILSLIAAGGISQVGGASPPAVVAPPGASVETGAGAKIINFAGVVTETVAAFIQNSGSALFTTAAFTVNSALTNIGPLPSFGIKITLSPTLSITIGDQSTAEKATKAEILTWLETHTHVGNNGAPTPVTPTDIVGTPLSLKDPLNSTLPNPIYVTDTLIS
jgi:hypothetical protein